MKPRIFIGSSVEALGIAYAVQKGLQYDAEVTVWNQGIFKLSSYALLDLIEVMNNSDYAIFIFNPDDVLIMRDKEMNIVRDNVIFEMGLFAGKLGRDKTFMLVPEHSDLHLPTDLLGINPGKFNPSRSDENISAAVGPFCSDIIIELKKFVWFDPQSFDGESDEAKKIARIRPYGHEYLLLAEFIRSRLSKINTLFNDLFSGSCFVKSRIVSGSEYFLYCRETMEDFGRFADVFGRIINSDIAEALGPTGVPSVVSDLKRVSDKISALALNLYHWEYRNEELVSVPELGKVKEISRGMSKIFLSQINRLPDELERVVKANQRINRTDEECRINLVIEPPNAFAEIIQIFKEFPEFTRSVR